MLCGFGFGTTIFGYVSTALVNPDNVKLIEGQDFYPDEVSKRVPNMLRICIICWTCLCFLSIVTISRNPEFVRVQKLREREEMLLETQQMNNLDMLVDDSPGKI